MTLTEVANIIEKLEIPVEIGDMFDDNLFRNRTAEIIDEVKARGRIVPCDLETSMGMIRIYVQEEDVEKFTRLIISEKDGEDDAS